MLLKPGCCCPQRVLLLAAAKIHWQCQYSCFPVMLDCTACIASLSWLPQLCTDRQLHLAANVFLHVFLRRMKTEITTGMSSSAAALACPLQLRAVCRHAVHTLLLAAAKCAGAGGPATNKCLCGLPAGSTCGLPAGGHCCPYIHELLLCTLLLSSLIHTVHLPCCCRHCCCGHCCCCRSCCRHCRCRFRPCCCRFAAATTAADAVTAAAQVAA